MSSKSIYWIYRGDVRALVAKDSTLVITTVHDEGHDTGVYSVDIENQSTIKSPLPGGVAMIRDDDSLYVCATDGHIWRGGIDKGRVESVGEAFEPAPTALAAVSKKQLAVAHGLSVSVVARADASVHQVIEFPERVTCLATDASGEWLVAGTDRGMVFVYEREEKPDFVLSSSAKLHEGEVTALLFETQELRVLSTGSDLKLLVTHVRGELEPEDRGGSGMHEKAITAMISGVEDRFYTTGLDSCVKAWPSGRTNRRPTTQKDGVVRTNALTLVQYNERPHVALAGQDGTVRVFAIEDEGKIGERALILRDAFAWATHELEHKDPARREKALRKLASFNDRRSIELIMGVAERDRDHKLKVLATELLGESNNPLAIKHLEKLLRSSAEDVRRAALEGARALHGAKVLRPLELALDSGHRDIGVEAIDALAALAPSDDKALELLTKAIDGPTAQVRVQAFSKLELHYGTDKPEAHLIALRSARPTIRVLAMVRCFKLGFLGEVRVEAAIRRLLEDGDADVRKNAYLVTVLRRPTLAKALRSRDAVLNRQLLDIEHYGKSKKERGKQPKLKEVAVSALSNEDYEPLLEAMASRTLDTCMRGAGGLSMLRDARAFGTLLQLSRARDVDARVEACKSFQALGDPRSLKRLKMMLRDGAEAVRDAAFSALLSLEADEPLQAASAGLVAEHEDVRKRGLQVLVEWLREHGEQEPAVSMLSRTLNDQFSNVRSEALKAALKLEIGGGAEAALRFGNESIHEEVRLDVLVEVMAQYTEDWAWNMLLEFYEDPAQSLRAEAFDYALQKAKRERRKQFLAEALRSRYADVRLKGVNELTQKRLEDFEDLLISALDDDDEQVRGVAISALVTADAHELLVRAMGSKHPDVRVRAASACATIGDGRALDVLVALATAAEPDRKNNKGDFDAWLDHAVQALQGIAQLGDPSARAALADLIESEHARLRKAAVHALVWTSRQDALGTLREMLRHRDEQVRREAAFGLAYWGDASGASMIFSKKSKIEDRVLASLGLFEEQEDQLFSLLDDNNLNARRRVFLTLLLLELNEDDGVPDKCLAALSSEHAELRMLAARGIDAFTDRARFEAFVLESFNTLCAQGKEPFTISMEIVNALSLALSHGSVQVKIRGAKLLEALHANKQDDFERQWAIYHKRYAGDLDALAAKQATEREANAEPEPGAVGRAWRFLKGVANKIAGGEEQDFNEALLQLVFGAYTGLSREQGSDSIRASAINALADLAKRREDFVWETRRVLLVALGDSSQAVRQRAFDILLDLEMNADVLANEALTTPFADMGSRGLQLLAEQSGAGSGVDLLRGVMLSKTDGLEFEAQKLLARDVELNEVWKIALQAASQKLRGAALNELVQQWELDETARQIVSTNALTSRFEDVRWRAANDLSHKQLEQDVAGVVFDVLIERLASTDRGDQNAAISGLKWLGDDRAAAKMLDRIDEDEDSSAQVSELIGAAASFRSTDITDRLFGYIDRDFERWTSFQAALTVSGHDQQNHDQDDDRPLDRSWMKDQHERRDEILARLLDVAYRLADGRMLGMLVPRARWSLSKAVDPYLAPLATFSKENIQHAAIAAIGWRLRKREGSADVLRRVLAGGSPAAQFIAAEGLALAGQKDGLSVLMTAVNFMESYDERRRAIHALGVLADVQALDLLLEIVTDPEHTLRAPAAEAIGHMSRGDRAEHIFKTLVELSDGYYDLAKSALTGLRYFGSAAAWRIIRDKAVNDSSSWWMRQHAAELLGDNGDVASIETLERLIREDDDSDVANSAAKSLRKIYGPDALEPDYALVQCRYTWLDEQDDTIKRLRERGDARKILEVLPRIQESCVDEFLKPLVTALLSRDPLPVDDVVGLLASEQVRTATVAAQIVGRAGLEASAHGATLVSAIESTDTQWQDARKRAAARQPGAAKILADATERYRLLVWAAGRLQVGLDALIAAASLPDEPSSLPIRREAIIATSAEWVGKQGVEVLAAAATGSDANLRELASVALRAVAPARAEALLAESIEDAVTFNRLLADGTEKTAEVLRSGAANIHVQGVVLGHLAARQDWEVLARTLRDSSLTDEVRLGALEALAASANEQVDEVLAGVGKDENEDEELRKAAWRALRRARRARRASTSQGEVTA